MGKDVDYPERTAQAKVTKAGDVWVHRKSGKRVTVTGRYGYGRVFLKHESGRETVKQDHYLADDYALETASQ